MPRRGRPRNAVPTIALNVQIPQDIRARMDLELYSELEGRVPHGAYQEFLVGLLRAHWEHRNLDLAPFLNTPPGTALVRGDPRTIAQLLEALTCTKAN